MMHLLVVNRHNFMPFVPRLKFNDFFNEFEAHFCPTHETQTSTSGSIKLLPSSSLTPVKILFPELD